MARLAYALMSAPGRMHVWASSAGDGLALSLQGEQVMKRMLALSWAAMLAVMAAGAQAQEVGAVSLVQVYGYETPPGSLRSPVFAQDPVVSNTLLETVEDGRLDVRFIDDSKLIVGSNSSVTVDRFVFDPNQGAGEAVVNVGVGVMRFVSGAIQPSGYRIRTPVATMGVRGTDFVVGVGPSGATAVAVLDGAVELTSSGGQSAVVEAGFTGATDGDGVDVSPTTGIPTLSTLTFGLVTETPDQDTNEDDVDEGDSSGD